MTVGVQRAHAASKGMDEGHLPHVVSQLRHFLRGVAYLISGFSLEFLRHLRRQCRGEPRGIAHHRLVDIPRRMPAENLIGLPSASLACPASRTHVPIH